MNWKRLNYLTHRWVGIVLGVMMLVWFVSGIAMMYYPYPELTERERLAALEPLPRAALPPVISLVQAREVAVAAGVVEIGTGRLQRLNGRWVYQLSESQRRISRGAVVDAESGTMVSPLGASAAMGVATRVAPSGATVVRTAFLRTADHYVMGVERKDAFPAWRVDFNDARRTSVYVAQSTGEPFAHVDQRTRLTTWIGSVPHWLYFQWLYDDIEVWIWVNILLPAAACMIALTGIIVGVRQLLPRRRRRGEWQVSGYHGVSKWHHVAGLVFGLLVLTWTLSGVLEVLGPSSSPSPAQVARARGGPISWSLPVSGASALQAAAFAQPGSEWVAAELERSGERQGYRVLARDGRSAWVDGVSGTLQPSLAVESASAVALRTVRGASAATMARLLTAYDAYYYAPHDRERALPVWRVRLNDAARSDVYVDPVTALPVAVVNASVRRWRWWREGLHDLDLPALNNRRPLWDVVVLPLMLGGALSALTGLWLSVRRLRRFSRGRAEA